MSVATFVTYWLLDRHGVTHTVLLPPLGCLGRRTCVEYTPFRVPWGHHLMFIVTFVTYCLLGRHGVTHT